MIAVTLAEEVPHILILVDAVPVDAVEPVPHLQGVLPLIGAVRPEVGDHRGAESGRPGIQDQHDHQPQHKVHEGTGHQDQRPLPGRLIGEGPWLVAVFVLPGHGAKAAEGHAAQGIHGLPLLPLEEDGAHAHGKLLHLHAAEFGHREMAQLMDDNQHTEKQDGKDNVKNAHLEKFSKT